MSTPRHTQEPWDGREVHRRDAQGTPFVFLSLTDYDRARACVNALAALTDEALAGGWTYAGQNAYALKLERDVAKWKEAHASALAAVRQTADERDKLAAALERISVFCGDMAIAGDGAVAVARAALAKVRHG